MAFQPKSFQNIVADMAAKVSSETPINDFTPGSNILTLLEAAAQEDFQQYVQMIELVRNYNLDTTEGEDLEKRAFEWGLTKKQARPHSGFVTIFDSRFAKISTKLYAGLPGPVAGSTTIFVDDASSLPTNGAIYIGRGTANAEGPIAYSTAPVDNTAFWTISLDTALVNDHGTDETIILSQFGNRTVNAGAEVRIPESDTSAEILFELNQDVILLDGEDEVQNILVTALEPGASSVPKNSIRQFVNPPFTGASVSNPKPFVNGSDEESDQELRDRIRETAQSLSRGTAVSIRNGILGIIDTETNSSITSANVIPPVTLADGPTRVFIDNGRGLEPELSPLGLETLISAATGGEKFFQLVQFPLVKANIISQTVEPFSLVGVETVILKVGTTEETFTFAATDFVQPGTVTAVEAAQAINNRATLFEARTITDEVGSRIIITPKTSLNENIQLNPASTANLAFNFTEREVFTLKLYKNDKLLTKDGLTATVVSETQPFDFSSAEFTTSDDATIASGSRIVEISASADNLLERVKPGDYVKSSLDTDTFFTRVRSVVSNSKLILEVNYPIGAQISGTPKLTVWSSPQLEVAANGDPDETEIVSFSKTDFASPAQALASEVLARIQKDLNLSKAELAVNNTKIRFTSFLENSSLSKMRIMGGHGSRALGFSTIVPLTGTVTTDATSRLVLGSGTMFTQELAEGQWFKASAHGSGAWTKIESIESDTRLYLTTPYNGLSGAALPSHSLTFGEESIGANRDYILNRSNGQIELIEPLVVGDSLTAGSINTRAFSDSVPHPFNFDSIGATSNLILRVDGGVIATATAPDALAPFSTITSTDLEGYAAGTFVGFHVECVSGSNAGQTEIVTTYSPSMGQVNLTIGFSNPIAIGDKFIFSQVIEFDHTNDFADPENVSADELAALLNTKLIGARAEKKLDNSVRIRTNAFLDGKLVIVGGSANGILLLQNENIESQEANIAFVSSQNTDRGGLSDARGFSLSPSQNLVVVFDDDAANKTFATPMKIEGEVSSVVGANEFMVGDFIGKYAADDFFNGFWVYWAAGAANEGTLQVVTDYEAATGKFTTVDVYPTSGPSPGPVVTDAALLVPRRAENLVKLFNDLNVTTLSTAGTVAVLGMTGNTLQISSKRPGTNGKVLITGGTANSIGIAIQGPVPGSPINDVNVNSIAGLFKGMPILVTTNAPSQALAFISDIQGSTAPYIVSLSNLDGTLLDATAFTFNNEATIRDLNGLKFDTTQIEGIDGYKHFTGLIQLAQWTIDGLDSNASTYPGIGAAGTQFEVIPPVLVKLRIVINITPVDGVSLSSVSEAVSSRILEYVNSRDVGEDVILSEIIAAAQAVTGVFDAEISNHTKNITVADGELARLEDSDLIIG